ncbi:MAG TPA: 7-carboxy-7-deazaguanine synthase QueE [Acidimicrobiales bacterium]|nr:7-carboxy-7-deazaguanine synthase QueE [Acidimicrobiales bacterium]
MTRATTLLVTEVFSAIQGEGALVGERQVFLRLTGCNIRCAYCDQPEALEKRPGPCRLEQTPGRRDWLWRDSPLSVSEVADAVDRLWRAGPHHSVSVTGGEPLLQARRLAALLPLLVGRGHSIYLETNGTLPGGLTSVLEWVDHIGMDIKLDSVDHEGVDLDTHRRFLQAGVARHLFVKIVIGPATAPGELDRAVAMVHDVSPDTEIFLQPVTPFADVKAAPSPGQVLDLQERALRQHRRVRVVPQTHKLIDQL